MNKTKKQKLSIVLLKTEAGHDLSKFLKDDSKFKPEKVPKEKKYGKNWKLFVKKNIPLEPLWSKYLGIEIKTSNASAVLFIPYNSQYVFAICFGYGSTALDKNKVVGDFGLKTALNSLDKDKIKSSDVFIPSDHSKQKRTQTTQDSSLTGHDIDKFSNILRRITGKTKQKYKDLFSSISGSDSITIDSDQPLEDLDKLCKKLYEIYEKKDCEKEFPEVFYTERVKDKDIINQLDDQLIRFLKDQSDNIYLDIPKPIDFQMVNSYQINFKNRKKHSITELDISKLYELLQKDKFLESLNVENLKKWDIILFDSNDSKSNRFSVYECLIFDCSISEKKYHLSNSYWYKIDQKLSQKIQKINESKYKKENLSDKKFIDYQHKNEAEYNQALANKWENAHCLDKKLIPMGGYDKIEPCDVLLCSASDEKAYFVHVKIKHQGSSGLSHLFQQGDVSLSLLLSKDETFIKGIEKTTKLSRKKLEKPHVHYLIIAKTKTQRLPLFSQISLLKTIQNIENKGVDVSWSFVNDISRS